MKASVLDPSAGPSGAGPAASDAPPAAPATRRPAPPRDNRLERYGRYAALRERGAIHRLRWPGMGTGIFVFRHAEALALFKDPRFRKSTPARRAAAEGNGAVAPVRGFGPDLVELDPPDHTRLRKLVVKAFTTRMIERLEGRVEALCNTLLDGMLARGETELVEDFAAVIPITVIAELLGLDIKDIASFRRFAYALTLSQTLGEGLGRTEPVKERFTLYLRAIFESRRREPRDDLISALVLAEQDGGRLSPDELVGMVYLLLLGGFVTTVNLLGSGAYALLRNPEQAELLRRDPDLWPSAVEELLRYESPLELSSTYFPESDLEFAGVRLPENATVRVVLPAANRDPLRFDEPDALDVTRDPCPHLSFAQGIHYCLGAPLARLEARIALRALFERAPGLRLADAEPRYLAHPVLRGLERLPLRL